MGCTAHRAKDHATSQAGFWEETISWNSVMQQDKLEEVEAIAASVKQQDVPMEPEVSLYGLCTSCHAEGHLYRSAHQTPLTAIL